MPARRVDRIPAHSSRQLIERADARGYSSAPIYALHEIDRSAEFYAAGRVVYDENGQPTRLEGAAQALAAAQQRKQPILVIVPVQYVGQLTGLHTAVVDVIADNGERAIVALRSPD